MKWRLFPILLLLALAMPAYASSHSNQQNLSKSQKQAMKTSQKYNKQQAKAQKKQMKEQNKAAKKWNKEHATRSTTG